MSRTATAPTTNHARPRRTKEDAMTTSAGSGTERRRWREAMTRAEWLRLSGFGGAVLALHAAGWGLFLYYSRHNPALAGLGTLAYTFGLRHAFDADHIAAIDNTTRKLLAAGQAPARRRLLLLARPLDDRLRARAGRSRSARQDRERADPRLPALGRLRRRRRVRHVPLDHRHPQPARAARHRPDLPRDARGALRRAAARGAAARPRLHEPPVRRRASSA